MKPPEKITTKCLQLRRPLMEDANAIFRQYAQDDEVTKFLAWRPHQSIRETRDYLGRCLSAWEHGSAFAWVITLADDEQLLGMVEIRIDRHRVDAGYVLARTHWGKGYMSEALQAVVDWALAQEEIYRISAFCDVENRPSIRVLEKVGMQREGTLRRWMTLPNLSEEPRDCYCYSKVK